MVTVETGARVHFGFQNLSLAHDRLYGGIGVGLDRPRLSIDAEQSEEIRCTDELRGYVESVIDALDVPGATVAVNECFDRHVGLGSGTQLALACLVGIGEAYGLDYDPRERAPELGRGGRSGVGVATFESGGFIVDAGHPTERFTSQLPESGTWRVPEPIVRQALPENWRFVLVTPEASSGRSGSQEDANMQSVVERANAGIADDIATVLTRRLLPAVVEEDIEQFGQAVERIGRLNGAWYADEQGGVYRPPAGTLVEKLRESSAILGVGQSSWGPTVYGVTRLDRAGEAKRAGESALTATAWSGAVRVVEPATGGHEVR